MNRVLQRGRSKRFKLRNQPGVTLPELMVGFALFGILLLLLSLALAQSSEVWTRTSSSSNSQLELRKAYAPLSLDLQQTRFRKLQRATAPVSLAGFDGDALWFLSAVDPVSGEPIRNSQGEPLWQRNILYYSVVPSNHTQVFGLSCVGGSDLQGYESRCPHKVLIRKVIDSGAPTGPTDEANPEELIINVVPYLTRPNGYDISTMTEPGLESVRIEARELLSFRVTLAATSQWPNEVAISLQAARVEQAQKKLRIGVDALDGFVHRFSFSVFPPD